MEQGVRRTTQNMDKNIDINQHKQTQDSTTSSYKYENNLASTNSFNLSTNSKSDETSTMDQKLSSESKITIVNTYSLLERTVNTQSNISEETLSFNGEDSSKMLLKYKQTKKGKLLRERKEFLKRMKHPEKWKVNVKKNARLKGEEYIGVGGKIVPAKEMGPPCNCRMRCAEKINEKERELLHKGFWKARTWEQRKQYIALSVKESPKQRTRCRGSVKHRRQVTFTYSLLLKGEFVTVCKSMFLSTFAVSEKFVRHSMDKKKVSPGGIIGPDQRGRHPPKTKKGEDVKNRVREHIKSFPTEKSTDPKDCTDKRYLDSTLSIAAMHKFYVLKCKEEGVHESDIVKESYYREMFKTEFNLGFKLAQNKEKKQIPNINSTGQK